jgi:hypothetical protein
MYPRTDEQRRLQAQARELAQSEFRPAAAATDASAAPTRRATSSAWARPDSWA